MVDVPETFKRDTTEGTISALLESWRQAERKIGQQGSEIGRLRKVIICAENAIPTSLRKSAGLIPSIEGLAEIAVAANAKACELVAENTALKVRVDQLEQTQVDSALLAVMASQSVAV